MKTCSKPFVAMSSKPKMSSTPMNCVSRPADTSNAALARCASQSKSLEKTDFANAWRSVVASAGSFGDVTDPSGVSRTRCVSAVANAAASTPNSFDAVSRAPCVAGDTLEPSCPSATNATSPTT